jgi:lipid-binding SYLF domain-containing protein
LLLGRLPGWLARSEEKNRKIRSLATRPAAEQKKGYVPFQFERIDFEMFEWMTRHNQEKSMNRFAQVFAAAAFLMLAAVPAVAASREELDAQVREAIAELYKHSSAAKELAGRSAGMLVFPKVVKGGIGIGGEYGEGALIIGGSTVGYYALAAGSIGFQLGVQQKSQVILFMTQHELDKFRKSDGWKAGVDGSVALATLGAGGQLDTETSKKPIIGFIYSNKGLMYNLTFEGAKLSKIDKD